MNAPRNAEPAPSAGTVMVDGVAYTIVPVVSMDFTELRDVKRLAMMPPGDVGAAMNKIDPDAWFAVLYVSMRRVNKSVTEASLAKILDRTPIAELAESVVLQEEPIEAPLPPPQASRPDAPAEPALTSSGDETQEPSTPEISGIQD